DPHVEDAERVVARRGEGDGGEEGGCDDGQVRELEQAEERAAMRVGHASRVHSAVMATGRAWPGAPRSGAEAVARREVAPAAWLPRGSGSGAAAGSPDG